MLSWGIILIACFYGQQITGFYTVPYLVPVLFLLCGCIRLQSLKKKWLYYAEIALLGGILFDVMYAINCFEITIFRDSCTVIAIVFIVMQCVKTLQNKAAWIGSLLYLLSFIGYWLISPENRFFISFMIINSIFTLYCALAIVNRFVKKQNESIENEVTMIHPIRKNIYMKIGALLLAGCCITFIVSLGKTMNHLSVMEHETNWQLYKGKETGIIELESMQFHSENTIDSHTNTVGMTFVCEEDKAPLIRAIALQSKDGNMNMIYQNEEVVFQKRNDGKYAYSIAFTFEHDIDEVILPSKIEVYAYQENNIKQDKEQQFTDAWVKEMITLQSLEAQHYQAELSDKNIKLLFTLDQNGNGVAFIKGDVLSHEETPPIVEYEFTIMGQDEMTASYRTREDYMHKVQDDVYFISFTNIHFSPMKFEPKGVRLCTYQVENHVLDVCTSAELKKQP